MSPASHDQDAECSVLAPLIPDIKSARQTTILASTSSSALAQLEVHQQRSYTSSYIISSALADTPCTSLGVSGMLEELNDLLSTDYTKVTIGDDRNAFLKLCIREEWDFGIAYARCRRWWASSQPLSPEALVELEEADKDMRRDAMNKKTQQVIHPNIPHRRVWDLFANRVIPYWATTVRLRAEPRQLAVVSHAWMSEDKRNFIDTPINSSSWPVPIPIDTTLDRVRIELLNMGMELAWLDVLCLRQAGSASKEDIRKKEWALDVPTIGSLYPRLRHTHENITIQYFSGLGRPFTFEDSDLESDRCWFNRAWTLQETCVNGLVAGKTSNSPWASSRGDDAFSRALGRAERSVSLSSADTFVMLTEMRNRYATGELDRIFGLAYLLGASPIPSYIVNEDPESAWKRMVEVIKSTARGEMFFHFPGPGLSGMQWAPSWTQIIDHDGDLPDKGLSSTETWSVTHDSTKSEFRFRGICIPCCRVSDFEKPKEEQPMSGYRTGTISFTDHEEKSHEFLCIAPHTHPIPSSSNGEYTLLGSTDSWHHWVLGNVAKDEETGKEKFEKVSVVRMLANREAVGRMKDIGVDKWVEDVVLA